MKRLKAYFIYLLFPIMLVTFAYAGDAPKVESDKDVDSVSQSNEPMDSKNKANQPASPPAVSIDKNSDLKVTPKLKKNSESKPKAPEVGDQNSIVLDKSVNGGLLTLNFYQSDIREILSVLAMTREVNIVMAQEVSGKISIHVYKVPLNEAIDAIALAGGFSYKKRGEIYYVYKPKEPRDPEGDSLQMRIFRLNYGFIDKVQDILSTIPGIRTVKIHEASKTIIVEDTIENIDKIAKVIHYWDTMPKQVLIEVTILQVNLTDDMTMGVDWQKVLGSVKIGTPQGFSRVREGVFDGTGTFANIVTGLGTQHSFAAVLDVLQTKTRVNTLSTPKILAIHGKPAKVQVGGKQGYRTTTLSTGFASEDIKFIDTGTILEITPYVDDDDQVLLDVKPRISSAVVDTTGVPRENRIEVSTTLRVRDGETVFIGGLIEDTKTNIKNIFPCIGSLPGLGLLFGRTQRGIVKSELVVLITPHVLDMELRGHTQEGLEKTRQMEEMFKQEPLSPQRQLLEEVH